LFDIFEQFLVEGAQLLGGRYERAGGVFGIEPSAFRL
jgi:hypothetical protein